MLQFMSRVLVTGFEPFGGQSTNPSALVAMALDGRQIGDCQVVGGLLPCVFGRALRELKHLLRQSKPKLVLCLGQAGGRSAIAIERVAINVDDACIADNAGATPIDQPIAVRGPVGYWSTLPIKAIVQALRNANIPAEISQSAGTFVCNHVFYGLMRSLSRKPVRGGFIHVPYSTEQATETQPGMSLIEMTRAIELAIATCLETDADIRLSDGSLH